MKGLACPAGSRVAPARLPNERPGRRETLRRGTVPGPASGARLMSARVSYPGPAAGKGRGR